MQHRLTPIVGLVLATIPTLALILSDRDLGPIGTVLAVILATVGIALLFEQEHRGRPVRPAWIVLAGVVVSSAAVMVEPRGSHDLWAYAMYGRIVSVYHANPWVLAPEHFSHDPFLARVGAGWRGTTSIYGPGFVGIAAVVTKIAGASALATQVLFKLLFAIATGAGGYLIYRRTRSPAATACVLLHPAIAVAGIAGGHNDVLVGLGLLGAVLFALDDRPVAAGLSAGLATLVKLTGGIGILALLIWSLTRHDSRWATRFGAASLGLVALAYLPFGLTGFSAFAQNRGSLSRASVWQIPRLLTGIDRQHAAANFGLPLGLTTTIVTVGTVVTVALTIAIAIRMRRAPDPIIPTIGAVGTFLVFAAYVLPWYPAWVIPVIALAPRRPMSRLLLLQGSVLVVIYELKFQGLSSGPAGVVWWLSVFASLGIAIAFLRSLRASPPTREADTRTNIER